MESQLMCELRGYADGRFEPKEWWRKRYHDARMVTCVPMAEALTVDQMKAVTRAGWKPRKKECYKNATELVSVSQHLAGLPEMQYVEGLALDPALPISIEHAWVRVGDLYIDPTAEVCLGADVTKWEYASLIEKGWDDLMEILAENGYYGDVYRHDFIKNLKNQTQTKQ